MKAIDTSVARLKARGYNWPIPWEIVEMLARKEDCYLSAYLCPAGKWTCGWGETDGVTQQTRWTEQQADDTFYGSVSAFASKVLSLCADAGATQNQLGAMTSLAYNIGLGEKGFAGSTVLKAHKRGDYAAASRAFSLWNKIRVNGTGPLVESRGLISRRAMEAAMYLQPEPDAPVELTGQAVADESKLTASPISQAGAVTAATGSAAVLSTFSDQATIVQTISATLKTIAGNLGIQPVVLVGVVLLVAGVATLYWRLKQRQGGWA